MDLDEEDLLLASAYFTLMYMHYKRKSQKSQKLQIRQKSQKARESRKSYTPQKPQESQQQQKSREPQKPKKSQKPQTLKTESQNSEKKRRRPRRFWMSALHKNRKSYTCSEMIANLRDEPSGMLTNFCRMSATDFEFLLNKIAPLIKKADTNMRGAIPVHERFAVALHFFATGDSFVKLSHLFRFSAITISRCVDEVCCALMEVLKDQIKLPQKEEKWIEISEEFNRRWNFPNCVGVWDGRHLVMQSPINIEHDNGNPRSSIVMLALIDAKYCFTYVDIGCQGRRSDGDVFQNSTFFNKLKKNELNLPADCPLPFKNEALPFVFVADDAFTLTTRFMTPYPGHHENGSHERIFNYRLSRARGVVENVFGIMASVFRVLRKPMLLESEKVSRITATCTLLHNFLQRSPTSAQQYGTFDKEMDGEIVEGSWRNESEGMTSLYPIRRAPRSASADGKHIQECFAEYFASNGAVPWQNKFC